MQKKAAKPAAPKQAKGPPALRPTESFQDLILALQQFWGEQGCVILQPYDMEVGAGTFHPATTLRALGPKPWNAAYVQPSRRPKDGRYGENPNRLQHYYQFQVIMKPSPADFQDLYLESLARIGIDPLVHDIRFVEDDWESPTLGAWGLGWEVWCDGMEVTQFTYFQQVGGFDCNPVSGEITYGLERLAMYVQGVDRVFDLSFNGRTDARKLTYGDVFLQAEQEYSRFNFEHADTGVLLQHFQRRGEGMQGAAGGRRAGAGGQRQAPQAGAAGLRPGHQGQPHLQPAGRARRHLGDRAAELHPARARAGQGLLRGVAADRRGWGVILSFRGLSRGIQPSARSGAQLSRWISGHKARDDSVAKVPSWLSCCWSCSRRRSRRGCRGGRRRICGGW